MTRIEDTVWVAQVAPSVWLHSTTHMTGGFMFPANGMIVDRPGGSLLVDTGWTPEQAEVLVRWAKKTLSNPIATAVGTHFHDDRIGGVETLRKNSIPTLAHPLTCSLAQKLGVPVPEPIAEFSGPSYRLNADCELFFPGAGHTRDNIIAWLPQQRVLFGGCFLKSSTSSGLGNIADAVVPDWADSLRRIDQQYPNRGMVIPGHGSIAGDPMAQTLALLAKQPVKP
jgi:metallo-beta-lactamase class B